MSSLSISYCVFNLVARLFPSLMIIVRDELVVLFKAPPALSSSLYSSICCRTFCLESLNRICCMTLYASLNHLSILAYCFKYFGSTLGSSYLEFDIYSSSIAFSFKSTSLFIFYLSPSSYKSSSSSIFVTVIAPALFGMLFFEECAESLLYIELVLLRRDLLWNLGSASRKEA